MSVCSPSPAEVERLVRVLDDYGRDELWLRAGHFYTLLTQPDQITFVAEDAAGRVLADRTGQVRSITLQLHARSIQIALGQRVHLARAGQGVRVEILPLCADHAFAAQRWPPV